MYLIPKWYNIAKFIATYIATYIATKKILKKVFLLIAIHYVDTLRMRKKIKQGIAHAFIQIFKDILQKQPRRIC